MFLSCAQAYEPRAGVAARVTTLGIRTSATVLDNIVLQFEMCRNPKPPDDSMPYFNRGATAE